MNFLSLIFRATPLPKLLLLEKWHRGEVRWRKHPLEETPRRGPLEKTSVGVNNAARSESGFGKRPLA
jgi:hypothetical protein